MVSKIIGQAMDKLRHHVGGNQRDEITSAIAKTMCAMLLPIPQVYRSVYRKLPEQGRKRSPHPLSVRRLQ